MKTGIDINGTVMRIERILSQIKCTVNFQFVTENNSYLNNKKFKSIKLISETIDKSYQ